MVPHLVKAQSCTSSTAVTRDNLTHMIIINMTAKVMGLTATATSTYLLTRALFSSFSLACLVVVSTWLSVSRSNWLSRYFTCWHTQRHTCSYTRHNYYTNTAQYNYYHTITAQYDYYHIIIAQHNYHIITDISFPSITLIITAGTLLTCMPTACNGDTGILITLKILLSYLKRYIHAKTDQWQSNIFHIKPAS